MRNFDDPTIWTGGSTRTGPEIIDHTIIPDDPHRWCYLIAVDGVPNRVYLLKPAALEYCANQPVGPVYELYLVARSWRG